MQLLWEYADFNIGGHLTDLKRQVHFMADVKEFAKKIAEDQALADALAETASTEEFLAKAKEAGFELTEEDLAKLAVVSEGELSDDELEGAAGGLMASAFFSTCPTCGQRVHVLLGCSTCKTGLMGALSDIDDFFA